MVHAAVIKNFINSQVSFDIHMYVYEIKYFDNASNFYERLNIYIHTHMYVHNVHKYGCYQLIKY